MVSWVKLAISFGVCFAGVVISYYFGYLWCCKNKKSDFINEIDTNNKNVISNCRNLYILHHPYGKGEVQGMKDKEFYVDTTMLLPVDEIIEYNSKEKKFFNVNYKSFKAQSNIIDKRGVYNLKL